MTDPLAQVDLEAKMIELVEQHERILREIRSRGEDAAAAEVTYKVAHAKALLSQAEGTIPEREATATVDTEAELFAHRTAAALLTAAIEAGRSNREAQATMRSVNANLRAQVTGE